MRDIPGFGIWLAMMTVMSGVVGVTGLGGCGPDKPTAGGPGERPAGGDASVSGGGDAGTTRPPPVQPPDGGTERPPPTMTSSAATGCVPSATDASTMAANPDAGAGGGRDAAADAAGGGAAGGGRPGSGGAGAGSGPGASGGQTMTGGADGSGGRALGPLADAGTPAAGGAGAGGSGGNPANTGGAPATGGRPANSGGASGSGGTPGSGGAAAPGSGGAGTGGATGAGGGDASGPAPAAGEVAIVELLINPASTDTGREWIELVNRAGHAISLGGLHIADAANDAAVDLGGAAGLLLPGGRAVLVQSADPTKNGGITAATAAVVGIFGTLVSLNNDADTISICVGSCTAGGVVVAKVTWDTTLGAGYDGHALVLDDAGKRCPATAAFGDAGSFGTPGAANAPCP